jgi:hypothetical protein
MKMSNELALKGPNQLKIEPSVRISGEFAKPDKTRQQNGSNPPLPSALRVDPAVLRGSLPFAHAKGYEIATSLGGMLREQKPPRKDG